MSGRINVAIWQCSYDSGRNGAPVSFVLMIVSEACLHATPWPSWVLLPCLVEIFQIRRRLIFLYGHQIAIGTDHIVLFADEDLLVTFVADIFRPVGLGGAFVFPRHRPWTRGIWQGNGVGQYLPSDDIPKFQQPPSNVAQGQYAVKIILDDPDQSRFPIGAQGSAAIYTAGESGAWAALRKISIRAHSWANWLYPISF